MTGLNLATFHFNQNLIKLLVSQSGGKIKSINQCNFYYWFLLARYAAILQNTPCVAMLSLFNIPSSDAPKMTQRPSQSIFSSTYWDRKQKEKYFFSLFLVFSDTYNSVLPIRPKPLLYPKDSTILTNSRHSSKADQTSCNILVSSIINIVMFTHW